jgi:hypothetical protein
MVAAYTLLDPAVYPHLNIYPAITGASKPVHPTPVPFASNSIKAVDVHPSFGYPFLVICTSLALERWPECPDIDLVQILRYTHGSTSILLLLVKLPDRRPKHPFVNHGFGWSRTYVQNRGSGSRLMRTHLRFQSCRTT